MSRYRRYLLRLLLAVSSVGLVGAGWQHWEQLQESSVTLLAMTAATAEKMTATETAAAANDSVVAPRRTVRVQAVQPILPKSQQSYTGVIRARYEMDWAFRVPGKVTNRFVEVGDRVQAGQLIATLDPHDYELAVKVAEADLQVEQASLKQAAAEEDRQDRLRGVNVLSSSEYELARAAREVAESRCRRAVESIALARRQLTYCELRADADAVVMEVPIEIGQVLTAGQLVARVARIGEMEAVIDIPEHRLNWARQTEAQLTCWSSSAQPYELRLRELAPLADPVTRTFRARYTILNPGSELALGMTATVHLQNPESVAYFEVPLSALLRDGTRPAVWVVEPKTGKLILAPVEVQQYRQKSVLLASGLLPGQLVVTAGVQKLDTAITVIPWQDPVQVTAN